MAATVRKRPSPPEPRILRSHEASCQAICFLENHIIASGDVEGYVSVWDLASSRPLFTWRPIPDDQNRPAVLNLHRLNRGRQLVSQSRGCSVILWDLGRAEATPISAFSTNSYHFCKTAMLRQSHSDQASGDSHLVACPTCEASECLLWDLRGPRPIQTLRPVMDNEKKGLCMALHLAKTANESGILLAAYENGSINGFDLRRMQPAFAAQLVQETALCLDVGPSGKQGVVGSAGSDLVVFDLDTAQHSIKIKQVLKLRHPGIADVKIRQDEKLFATAGWDHRVRAYRWEDRQPLAILRGHSESVYGLDFAPNLGTLASVSKDARIALWEFYPPAESNA